MQPVNYQYLCYTNVQSMIIWFGYRFQSWDINRYCAGHRLSCSNSLISASNEQPYLKCNFRPFQYLCSILIVPSRENVIVSFLGIRSLTTFQALSGNCLGHEIWGDMNFIHNTSNIKATEFSDLGIDSCAQNSQYVVVAVVLVLLFPWVFCPLPSRHVTTPQSPHHTSSQLRLSGIEMGNEFSLFDKCIVVLSN